MTDFTNGAAPPDQQPGGPGEFASTPAWSVRSLHDLNEAVRRGRRADDPWRLRQEAERVAGDRARASRAHEERAADAARAEMDRYRNAWENT